MFPNMLRYLRKREGYTQKEMAAALGIGQSTLASYERGVREPNFEMLETIADFFNVNMSTLISEDAQTATPAPLSDESALNSELIRMLVSLTPEEEAKVTGYIQGLMANRKD